LLVQVAGHDLTEHIALANGERIEPGTIQCRFIAEATGSGVLSYEAGDSGKQVSGCNGFSQEGE
jgi:hypothetical protein